ncbi:glycosyltransferase family 8 protein [Nocardiopsis sp. HNM0947]|uniref:Glycosyltransferase family 8 protein n=1 Tax=Nocardiopsis coralli TaxID=2772213 RepID=A0ABR9P082_9ACTN|nr:glycosyltransferase family 8 protein [Nocardiopsis coralli]MBE2997223.1 glycosyltransferase family 8 protein [Nocardiopsis coralli]
MNSFARPSTTTVAFAVDENYCLPLTVAWQSLRDCAPDLVPALDVRVLHTGLSGASLRRLTGHAARLGICVRFHHVHLPVMEYPVAFGGAHANYLRMLLPRVLPEVGRVLYLDSDLLVLGDLREVLDTDLRGSCIGAVRDPVNPAYRFGKAMPGWVELGIPGDREYFNSGLMLIDLDRSREEGFFERGFVFVEEYPQHIRLWDQDALNWAADDRWERFPAEWNAFPFSALNRTPWVRYTAEDLMPMGRLLDAEVGARVLHYASPAKPWMGLLPSGRASSLYHEYLDPVLSADGTPREQLTKGTQ